MAWIITNNVNSIRFDDGSIVYDIQKNDITLKEDGSCVFVFVDNQQLRGFTKLSLDYNEVTTPFATSSAQLRDILQGYADTSVPGDSGGNTNIEASITATTDRDWETSL